MTFPSSTPGTPLIPSCALRYEVCFAALSCRAVPCFFGPRVVVRCMEVLILYALCVGEWTLRGCAVHGGSGSINLAWLCGAWRFAFLYALCVGSTSLAWLCGAWSSAAVGLACLCGGFSDKTTARFGTVPDVPAAFATDTLVIICDRYA